MPNLITTANNSVTTWTTNQTDNGSYWDGMWIPTDTWTPVTQPEPGGVIFPEGVSDGTTIWVDGEPVTLGELIRLMRKMAKILELELDAYDVAEELGQDDDSV
jgi:hypothetical protein